MYNETKQIVCAKFRQTENYIICSFSLCSFGALSLVPSRWGPGRRDPVIKVKNKIERASRFYGISRGQKVGYDVGFCCEWEKEEKNQGLRSEKNGNKLFYSKFVMRTEQNKYGLDPPDSRSRTARFGAFYFLNTCVPTILNYLFVGRWKNILGLKIKTKHTSHTLNEPRRI